MFDLTKIEEQLEERMKVLNWVINGMGIHGFKISDTKILHWGWITKNYNVYNKRKY